MLAEVAVGTLAGVAALLDGGTIFAFTNLFPYGFGLGVLVGLAVISIVFDSVLCSIPIFFYSRCIIQIIILSYFTHTTNTKYQIHTSEHE
jgi:hypothetical protein